MTFRFEDLEDHFVHFSGRRLIALRLYDSGAPCLLSLGRVG